MASDILDVLNISEETRIQQKKNKENDKLKKLGSSREPIYQTDDYASANKKRKVSAMNRELYNLIGSNLPPVAVDTSSFRFKDKLKQTKDTKPWNWKSFTNSARTDGLILHHWVKGDDNGIGEYRYAKYNTKLDIPDFTEEEFEKDLKDVNEDWDYKETKYLFDLANQFDLRWAVVMDRYEYDGEKERTVEDLKDQLYKISAKLLTLQGSKDSGLIKGLQLFDKEKEIERKQYLTKLIHRAPTEIAEEESLVIEARKFELAAKKMMIERAQLLQLLDSPQSSASIQQYLTPSGLAQLYNSLMNVDKSKKRKPEVPVAPQLGPNAIPHTQQLQQMARNKKINGSNGGVSNTNGNTNSSSNSNNNPKRKDAKKREDSKQPAAITEVQQLLQKNLTAEELEVYGIQYHEERIQPGVFFRSQKLSTFKPTVQVRVGEILGQLGVSVKPTMPTGPVCNKFDQLLQSIAQLVDIKKQNDKLEAEITLIKRQKGLLS